MDLLFDLLEIKATCITFSLHTYKRIYGLLQSYGYIKKSDGKNIYLEKEGKTYKIQLTYNSKIKKHTFHFFFYPPFNMANADKFIKDFFKKYIFEDIANYKLKIAGNTEVTLDLKNFDLRFIENLQNAVNKLRDTDKYYSHTKINNAFVKLYLKEKAIRLETKVGNGLYNPLQILKEVLDVKINLLDDENRHELYFEYIFNSLLKIEAILEKLTENQSALTNITTSIPVLLDSFQNNMNQRFEEIYLQDQDTQKGLTMLAQNQGLLINLTEKRFEEVYNKIATESRHIEARIEEAGIIFKLKRLFKELIKRIKGWIMSE